MGIIKSLAVNVGKQKPMKYKKKVKIIENFGIEGDRFSKLNDNRQIMIVNAKLYDLHKLEQGSLRENILIENIDLNSCYEGQNVLVNGSIKMTITFVKDACASINYNDPETIEKLQGNMYVFAKPLDTGFLWLEDKIEIL